MPLTYITDESGVYELTTEAGVWIAEGSADVIISVRVRDAAVASLVLSDAGVQGAVSGLDRSANPLNVSERAGSATLRDSKAGSVTVSDLD